jgi:hypothetical protein
MPAPKRRPTNVVSVVVDSEVNLDQVGELVGRIGGLVGCRTCGLIGIDLRITGGDPAELKQLGLAELAGVRSVVVTQE